MSLISGGSIEQIDYALHELSDEDNITKARKAGEKHYEQFTTEQYNHLRRLAKNDLYFLCKGVLGFDKLSPNLHGHVCQWMQNTDNEQFREILLPRGHYKSTVITVGDGIRIALPDDSGDAPWPRNLGMNCRILIGHEVHDSAARFLYGISSHFLGNPRLMALFPECVPNPRKNRVNRYELELPRSEFWNEPTFDTMGVGGRSQGRHYNYLKMDDLFGDKARDSQTERLATYEWFDNLQSFFSTFTKDHMDLVGTRWAFDDLYSHAHQRYGKRLLKYIRGAEEVDPKTGERHPIFPEEFTLESFEILKQNRRVWTAQYANNPAEGASKFQPEWKRFYTWVNDNTISVGEGASLNVRDLDVVIFCDPAMDGLGGYVVTGCDSKNRVFILDCMKKSMKPPEVIDWLFRSVLRWQPRCVVFEAVLFSEVFHYWIQREMGLRGVRFKIEAARTRNRSKEMRVEGLANYFAAGSIYFNPLQRELIEEFDSFGATSNYHMLDALAYGPEFWRAGLSKSAMADNEKAVAGLLQNRSVLTGYSII